MSIFPAETTSRRAGRRTVSRDVAITRAAAALLWTIAYLLALHGQQVLTDANVPLTAGLLLAAYPAIDAVATITEIHHRPERDELRAGIVIDGLAIISLLVATLSLDTQAVLIAFGVWALPSGLLQIARAWRTDRPRRAQLPLIISGSISAIAGISFAAMAGQHVAHLSYLGGYAVLGAVFFLVWTVIDRRRHPSS